MIAPLLLLASLGAAAPAPSLEARTVLSEDRFYFCHERDYRMTRYEQQWCPLIDEESLCPSLLHACELPPLADADDGVGDGSWLPGTTGGSGSGNGRGAGAGREEKAPEEKPDPMEMPDLSGVAQVLLFALIGAGVFFVVRALWGLLSKKRDDENEPAATAAESDAPAIAMGASLGPVETDVSRLLARARERAARGEYDEALQDTYAALLRRLDGDGLIAIHKGRTNGDYVRDLRERRDLQGEVRGIVRDVERVHFGKKPASAALFQSVFERVAPIATRALVALGLLLLLPTTSSCGSAKARVDYGAVGSTRPSGTAAVVQLLRDQDVLTRIRRKPLSELRDQSGTLVLLEGASLDEETWRVVLEWASRPQRTLIIAGAGPLPDSLGMGRAADPETTSLVTTSFPWTDELGDLSLAIPPGRRLVIDDEDAVTPVLRRGGSVYAASRSHGLGQVIVLADRHLFSNVALSVADNAELLAQLFAPSLGGVELCDQLTGAGAETPLESIAQAKLTPLVVQMLALLALFLVWKGWPFAKLRDPKTQSRRAFADHVRALGVTYARAHASQHALGLYATWAIERLRERTHRGRRAGLVQLAEAIAKRTGRSESDVMRVLVDAQSVSEEAAPPSFRESGGAGPRSTRGASTSAGASDQALMNELDQFLSLTGKGPVSKQKEAKS